MKTLTLLIALTHTSLAAAGTLTITGTDFAAAATVKIGGQPATNVNVASDTSMTAPTPIHFR